MPIEERSFRRKIDSSRLFTFNNWELEAIFEGWYFLKSGWQPLKDLNFLSRKRFLCIMQRHNSRKQMACLGEKNDLKNFREAIMNTKICSWTKMTNNWLKKLQRTVKKIQEKAKVSQIMRKNEEKKTNKNK